jgi:hypothetical protein
MRVEVLRKREALLGGKPLSDLPLSEDESSALESTFVGSTAKLSIKKLAYWGASPIMIRNGSEYPGNQHAIVELRWV